MTDNVSTYAARAGERMREVRKDRGLSLKHVEQASDGRFMAAVIGSYERASRNVTVEWLAEYADWLGVDIRLLLPPDIMTELRDKFPQVSSPTLCRWWRDLAESGPAA